MTNKKQTKTGVKPLKDYVIMVIKTHNAQGGFYERNPTCGAVPKGMVLDSIAKDGYIPFVTYMRLVEQGKDGNEIIKYITTLSRLANERLEKIAEKQRSQKLLTELLKDIGEIEHSDQNYMNGTACFLQPALELPSLESLNISDYLKESDTMFGGWNMSAMNRTYHSEEQAKLGAHSEMEAKRLAEVEKSCNKVLDDLVAA